MKLEMAQNFVKFSTFTHAYLVSTCEKEKHQKNVIKETCINKNLNFTNIITFTIFRLK